jgi:hypothetical protein
MRNFRMFFVLAIGVMLFLFVARIAIVAFIVAGVLSILYAVFRRLRDFISYDRFGRPYHQRAARHGRYHGRREGPESFFHGFAERGRPSPVVQVVEIK